MQSTQRLSDVGTGKLQGIETTIPTTMPRNFHITGSRSNVDSLNFHTFSGSTTLPRNQTFSRTNSCKVMQQNMTNNMHRNNLTLPRQSSSSSINSNIMIKNCKNSCSNLSRQNIAGSNVCILPSQLSYTDPNNMMRQTTCSYGFPYFHNSVSSLVSTNSASANKFVQNEIFQKPNNINIKHQDLSAKFSSIENPSNKSFSKLYPLENDNENVGCQFASVLSPRYCKVNVSENMQQKTVLFADQTSLGPRGEITPFSVLNKCPPEFQT